MMEEPDLLSQFEAVVDTLQKTHDEVAPSGTVALLRPHQLKHMLDVQKGVLKWVEGLGKTKV